MNFQRKCVCSAFRFCVAPGQIYPAWNSSVRRCWNTLDLICTESENSSYEVTCRQLLCIAAYLLNSSLPVCLIPSLAQPSTDC